jgi:eukaryotic-like serine/threonine-protein kinase
MNEETLFQEALSRSSSERAAFLEQACAGRPDLRASVEALLAAHDKSSNILDQAHGLDTGEFSPQPNQTPDNRSAVESGLVIACRYTLVERIGEGGMGEVWVAKQSEPVKRKVAIKLIKTGMDSKAVLARFEQERQALALMDHPNISRVLDGGMTPTGQPFFVMDLVNGLSLTRFCDEAKLTLRQRLELFVPICQAVQHAHQKGIVHRDLKPANILVTMIDAKPVPKIIDFGVAKATSGRLTDESLSTHFGAVVGTLEYMSPEQAGYSGDDVDTRADIYSLGVLLYELLTGLRPIDAKRLRKAALTEMIRIIREEEPSKPSTRLSTDESLASSAALRHMEPRKLMAQLRGDLDWVVMKCLEKQRERRYETANGLARDIQRYLSDEPVEACPPSATYRLRKFGKKNRAALTSAAAIALLLVAGAGVSIWQAVRATQAEQAERLAKLDAEEKAAAEKAARQDEERQRKFAEAISKFVWEDFLALTSVEGQDRFGGEGKEALSKDTTLQQLLDRAAEKLRNRKDLDPLIEAMLCWVIGVNYRGAGEAAKGVPFLERAVELRMQTLGQDHWETAVAQRSLSVCYGAAGQHDKSLPLAETVLRTRKATQGPDHPDTLRAMAALANVYQNAGKTELALPLVEETLRLQKTKLGSDDPDVLLSMHDLAKAYHASGQLDKAVPLAEETLAMIKTRLGPDHPHTLICMATLASAYKASGQLAKALPLFEDTLARQKVKLGQDHPNTLGTMNNLAMAYRANGQPGKALPLLEETSAKTTVKLGPDHPDTLSNMQALAHTYRDLGQFDKALPLFEDTLAKRRVRFGSDDFKTLESMHNLADAFRESGQPAKAISIFEETLAKWKATVGPEHYETLNTMHALARSYQAAGQTARALPLYEESFEKQKAKLGSDDPITLTIMNNLALAYFAKGQTTKGQALLEETLAKRRVKLGPDHHDTINSMHNLAVMYGETGQLDKSLPLYKETVAKRKAKLGSDHPDTLSTMGSFAVLCWSQKQLNESVPLFEELLSLQEKRLGRGHADTIVTITNLGVNYKDAGRLADAIPLLEEGFRASERHPLPLFFAGPNLLDAYRKTGKSGEAAKLMDKLLADAHVQFPKNSPQLAYQLIAIGRARVEDREYATAEAPLREALAIGEKNQPNDWKTFYAQALLGNALMGQKRYDDAEPLLLKGCDGMKQRAKNIPPIHAEKLHMALDRLIELYAATNKPDEVKKWQAERAKYPEPKKEPEK